MVLRDLPAQAGRVLGAVSVLLRVEAGMTLTVYKDMVQRSPEWYEARRGIVTASAVGKLVTPSTIKVASNDKTRGLIMDLVAERITGEVEETPVTDDMQRGIDHEPIARARYAEVNGVEVQHVGFMVRTIAGAKIGCSPDGLIGDERGTEPRGLLEIKCPRAKGHIQTILRDEVPPEHIAQCQAALYVSGREWIDFVSFCAGLPLYTKRVYPEAKWQEAITGALVAFEEAAEQMFSDYFERAEQLPATDPILDITDWSRAS